MDADINDETTALSPKGTFGLHPTHSNSNRMDLYAAHSNSRSTDPPKNGLHIKMPSVPRLSSRLKSPNTILNNSRKEYRFVRDSTPVTGQAIPNTLKSSVDIMLYDSRDIDDDSTATTEATELNNSIQNNDGGRRDVIDYAITDTMQSSADLDEDDIIFDDESPHHQKTRGDHKARCNCCLWLHKYKSSIILTILISLALVCLQLLVDRDDMSMSTIYLEFALILVALWLTFRLLWGLISYALFVCTANHWCIHRFSNVETLVFYIQHSIYYLGYSLFLTFCYVVFGYQQTHHGEMERVDDLIDNADPKMVESIEKLFLCGMVLFYGLFVKTILIRWICLHHYLSSQLVKIKKIQTVRIMAQDITQ
eukprot:168925_1